MDENDTGQSGLDRRQLLKRGAVIGGTMVWATPVVQSFAAPVYAVGSGQCVVVECHYYPKFKEYRRTTYVADQSCCDLMSGDATHGDCTPLSAKTTTASQEPCPTK